MNKTRKGMRLMYAADSLSIDYLCIEIGSIFFDVVHYEKEYY